MAHILVIEDNNDINNLLKELPVEEEICGLQKRTPRSRM